MADDYLEQLAAEIDMENTYRSRITSGDESESAGLREPRYQCFFCKEWFTEAEAKEHFTDESAKRDWEHWWECYYPAMGLNGSSQFKTIEAATRDSWIAAKAALAPAISRPSTPRGGDCTEQPERGWLIEKMGKDGPEWLHVQDWGGFGWSKDSLKAIRFARREDGEKVCVLVEDADSVTEHMWEDISRPPMQGSH